MSRHHSHINTAVTVLSSYDGVQPFAPHLKKFFSGQKKYGSKDRRQIRHLCYSYFRAARLLDHIEEITEKVVTAHLLCVNEADPLLLTIKPTWAVIAGETIETKLEKLELDIHQLFPSVDTVEDDIDPLAFCISHFTQPDLFIRIRSGHKDNILHKLKVAQLPHQLTGSDVLRLPSTSKVEGILRVNNEVVIQDLSSQRVGELLDIVASHHKANSGKLKVWDCCAASGGKSILAVDRLGDIELTVSDIRHSILHNLRRRLDQANISEYRSLQLDLTDASQVERMETYDLVIADVPCSGSGTWSRTPERLTQFAVDEIAEYQQLQQSILTNIITKIKPGGHLLYITCSVYNQENSEIAQHLIQNGNMRLVGSNIYKGYSDRADTMFAALFSH